MEQNLKLIAIIPPPEVYAEVRSLQEYIAHHWGPRHALRTPPHITIIPPIALNSAQTGWLFGMAYAMAGTLTPFQLELNGFDFFKPRVVYIRPIVSEPLQELHEIWQSALLSKMPHILDTYPQRPYHPHLTLAHKDVTRPQFDQMMLYFKNKPFHMHFTVDRFCILTHRDHGWEMEREYYFQN